MGVEGGQLFPPGLPVNAPDPQRDQVAIVPVHPSNRRREKHGRCRRLIRRRERQHPQNGRIQHREHAAFEVKLAAVFLGDVRHVDEGREGGLHIVGAEDEDFRRRDRVEPFLDPSPHRREKRGCPDDLPISVISGAISIHPGGHYKYPVESLGVMCRR